jgi:hypothetical protein
MKGRPKEGVTARVTVALTSWKPSEVLVVTYGFMGDGLGGGFDSRRLHLCKLGVDDRIGLVIGFS